MTKANNNFAFRRVVVITLFIVAMAGLAWRAFGLHVSHQAFYQQQGDARHLRTVEIPAHRGNIYDRNGDALAISTPVDSVWAQPMRLVTQLEQTDQLSALLGLDAERLHARVLANQGREFMYIKRHVQPGIAQQVMDLGIDGVALQREYRRYYPTAEVSAHVLGFTNIDDQGQEGIELAYDDWLSGKPGAKRILRDRLGRAVDDIERINPAQPGQDLYLSIDRRLQYLTYRALKAAVKEHQAKSASAVLLDVDTGEVLAMANQPSFNPNNRRALRPAHTRNRAITDLFEPGSTMKPLTMAAALESGQWNHRDSVRTSPGYMRVQGNSIKDMRNFGELSLPAVIYKSSNVGISKIALSLSPEQQWHTYHRFGLGMTTGSGFPGEVGGHFDVYNSSGDFERAALAFGYGLSVTPLQLSRAYAAIAADGVLKPVSFIRVDETVRGERAVSEKVAKQLRLMMEQVVSTKGTARLASVPNYRVAGKTGTVHKSTEGGYAEERYQAVFAGMAPLEQPRLAMVVMVDEPSKDDYYGGKVAAPVFARVMSGALRLLDIAPDNLKLGQRAESQTASQDGQV